MALPPYSCEDIEAIRGYNDELNHQIKQLEDTLHDTKEKLREAEKELNKTRAQLRNEERTELGDERNQSRQQPRQREQARNFNEINNSNGDGSNDDLKNKMNHLEKKLDDTAAKLQQNEELEDLRNRVTDLQKKLNNTAAELQQTTESINQAKHQQDENGNNYSGQHSGWSAWSYLYDGLKFVAGLIVIGAIGAICYGFKFIFF